MRSYKMAVYNIHDEVVIEADPRVSLDALCEQMGRTPPWAEGLRFAALTPIFLPELFKLVVAICRLLKIKYK